MSNIDINLTTSCNMRCAFCGSWGFGKAKTFVDLDVVDRTLHAARAAGYSVATLTGGEPTLHPRFAEIVRLARRRGFMTVVTTNGLRATPDMLDAYRDCGTVVRVSMHTLDPDYHWRLTGAPTLHRVQTNMTRLADAGVNFGMGCTIEEANLHEVPHLAEFAWSVGAYYVRFSPVVGIRGAADTALDVRFYRGLLRTLFRTILANRDLLQHAPARMPTQLRGQTTYMLTRACAAGSALHVIHDCEGRLQPCSFLPEETGLCIDASVDPAAGIAASWARMQQLQDGLRGRLQGRCGTCEYAATCLGGCLAPKVDRGLSFDADQPLCIKELVEDAMRGCTDGEQQFLMSYWAGIYRRKTSGQETPKNCVRHLPLWELNFRPGDRDATRFVCGEVDACVPC